ncbi:hypothetical protein Tco_1576750 [Tanacetum coccineum]
MNLSTMHLDFLADGNLRELSGEEAWEAIENFAQGQKEWDNPQKIISEQELANLKAQAKRLLGNKEVYTPPVTYPEEVEEIIGILMKVEPLDKIELDDLGLNTCNHDIPLSSREVPSFDEPKPQPQPLRNCPSLDVSLGDKRSPDPTIKPLSPDSFRMKVVDLLTIHTPSSPHLASFHPKDAYCYYHICIDDPKKHYGFKPGLLGQSGSQGVDFSNLEMVENDWLYLMRRSLEVLRKFHWTILGGRFNQLSHVMSVNFPFPIALGWQLEEIHVTWAHLEKKWTRLRLYTKSFKETMNTEHGDDVVITKRRRQDFQSDDVMDLATASCRRLYLNGPYFAADMNLRQLSGEEAWEAIENFAYGQKEWDNPPNIISEQELANLKAQEETIGIPMEVEPLDKTELEDLGLNTCNHDIPLSSKEVPSFDEPKPQP